MPGSDYGEKTTRQLRILTDRGTEYCDKVEHHDYQLYLEVHDIEHTRTSVRSPQTNSIWERFHETTLKDGKLIWKDKRIH